MDALIYHADSYKYSHFKQYPLGTQYVSSYIESRGGKYDTTVFFGLQGFIKKYLNTPITKSDVDRMEKLIGLHGVSFNRAGWDRIVNKHGGYMPVAIYAVPEGSVVPTNNALVRVTNTDPELPWVTSFIETALLRAIWYPTTVATLSREIKKTLAEYMDKTVGNRDGLEFMLHDFGARGVSSAESAAIGGAAHIVNFMGSDTFEGILWLMEMGYVDEYEMPAFSVDATEHSTVTTWGKDRESEMYKSYINSARDGQIMSCVSDSYDIRNAAQNIWGDELKESVKALGEKGARLVVRPDSGDPVTTPVQVVKDLMAKFHEYCKVTEKGNALLPDFLRVLQGDGIDHESIKKILNLATKEFIATNNLVFGMGGGLLQHMNRDTQKFAMKASAVQIDGNWKPVFKEAPGKNSKRGMVALVGNSTETYYPYNDPFSTFLIGDRWRECWNTGITIGHATLAEVRDRAKI